MLYNINQPAEPNSWNDKAHLISIQRTMEFLEIDMMNMTTSLLYITNYIKTNKIGWRDINNVPALNVFWEATCITKFIQLISSQLVNWFLQTKLCWKVLNESYLHIYRMYKSDNKQLISGTSFDHVMAIACTQTIILLYISLYLRIRPQT